MEGRKSLRDIDNLTRHMLQHPGSRQDWLKWLDLAGAYIPDLSRGSVFDQASTAIDAAVEGQGVALAGQAWSTGPDKRASGSTFFDVSRSAIPAGLSAHGSQRCLPRSKRSRNWLLAEAAEDAKNSPDVGACYQINRPSDRESARQINLASGSLFQTHVPSKKSIVVMGFR